MTTTPHCHLLRQQAEQAVESFPQLRENLGYQVLSDGKTCEMDPVATQDARIDLYQTWAAYEQSAQNERAASWPLFYTFFQEAPIRGALLYSKLGDVTVEGAAYLLQQIRNAEFAEAGKGMLMGVGNAFIHVVPHLWDAVRDSVVHPELSNEVLVEIWARPILDVETVLGSYEMAGAFAKAPSAIKAGAGAYADAIKGAADAVRNNIDSNGGMVLVTGDVPVAAQAAATFPAEVEIFAPGALLMSGPNGNGGRGPTNTDPSWPARRISRETRGPESSDEIIADLARDVGADSAPAEPPASVVERDTIVSGPPEGMMSESELKAAREVYGEGHPTAVAKVADELPTTRPFEAWDDSVAADGSPLPAPEAAPEVVVPAPQQARASTPPVRPRQVIRPQPSMLSGSYDIPIIGPLPKSVVWLGIPGAALVGGAAAYFVSGEEETVNKK